MKLAEIGCETIQSVKVRVHHSNMVKPKIRLRIMISELYLLMSYGVGSSKKVIGILATKFDLVSWEK